MNDYIAQRDLVAEFSDGARANVSLRIGVPRLGAHGTWVCHASIDGLPHRPLEAHGGDSWQALLLALKNVRGAMERFVRSGGKLYFPSDEESGAVPVAELFSDDRPE